MRAGFLLVLAPPDRLALDAGLVLLAALAAVDLGRVRAGARRTVVAFLVAGFFGVAVLRFAARVGLRAPLIFFVAGRVAAREPLTAGLVAARELPLAGAARFLAGGRAAERCGLAARLGAGLVRARVDADFAVERTGAALRAAALVVDLTARRGAGLAGVRAAVGLRAPAVLALRAGLAGLAIGLFGAALGALRLGALGAGFAAFVADLAARAGAGRLTALAGLVAVT